MSLGILSVALGSEQDVVVARQRARQVARHLGFETQDQARIATAVSEIARNVVQYAGRGKLSFALEGRTAPQLLVMHFEDEGAGIRDLEAVLAGRYRSQTGMGLGLLGARRLMDQFQLDSAPGRGTRVWLRKFLPRAGRVLDAAAVGRVAEGLMREGLQNPLAEVQHQNQELLRTLDELRRRQDELLQLNRELEDTNRGVVALYAELDEKAEHLRRADAMKTRFLSNMSHEFRTPLNSIVAIARLLEQRSDGDLTAEQARQVGFVLKAAHALTELVDDLLDLAKVEAGKIVVRPIDCELPKLFGALRGMLRPLLVTDTVRLVFEEPVGLPVLYTDEAKVSQILRNFLSNALKFTERGEIRIKAGAAPDGQGVAISVADTGIGIAPEDQGRIFEEFGQVEHAVQRKVKGTGLGLALSRRLAEVLGGSISLESQLGQGSTFTLHLPLVYAPRTPLAPETTDLDPGLVPVLVVEDEPGTRHVYERLLRGSPFQPLLAPSVREAHAWLRRVRPRAVILDIRLAGEDAWSFLSELKSNPGPALPVVVVSSVDDPSKALGLGADAYAAQPVEREWLLGRLSQLTGLAPRSVLIVDDDAGARYVLAALCRELGLACQEAGDGAEALARVRLDPPHAILLDLVMPEVHGEEVLARLRAAPETAAVPVVITTSKVLAAEERRELENHRAVLWPKSLLAAPDAGALLADALRRAAAATARAGEPTVPAVPGERTLH